MDSICMYTLHTHHTNNFHLHFLLEVSHHLKTTSIIMSIFHYDPSMLSTQMYDRSAYKLVQSNRWADLPITDLGGQPTCDVTIGYLLKWLETGNQHHTWW